MIEHATSGSAALPQYECESCLHRVGAEHQPANCPACGNEMYNISVPRE